MGVLLPSGLLPVPARTETPRAAQAGQVITVSADGKACIVDVAGTQATAVIPGSVKGVAQGRTVEVRVQGNDRVVTSVLTAIPTRTYTASTTVTRAVPTGQVVKPPDVSQVFGDGGDGVFYSAPGIGGNLSYPLAHGDLAAAWSAIDTNRLSINNMLSLLRTYNSAIVDLATQVNRQRDQINALTAALQGVIGAVNSQRGNADVLDGVRNVIGTLTVDLKEQGITK